MHGAIIIPVFLGVLMASEAARAYLLGRYILKREYLAFVAATIHMLLSRTVAGFTAVPLRPFSPFEFPRHRGCEMRGRLEIVVEVFVAGLARVSAEV